MTSSPIQDFAEACARSEAQWLEDVIVAATPRWAHFLAQLSMWRGMRWMHIFPLPLVRRFVAVTVKRDSRTVYPEKGFRAGTAIGIERVRVFKQGTLIAEQEFRDGRFIRSNH